MGEIDLNSLKGVASECPGFQARATARAVTRFYNACFKPLGLTAEQFSLLAGIGEAEGATLVDLAISSGVDATTLSRSVQNLERRNLVRAKGGRGRAGKRLSLTSSARQIMSEALPLWERATAELSLRLGDEKLQPARRAMSELAEAAEECASAAAESSSEA